MVLGGNDIRVCNWSHRRYNFAAVTQLTLPNNGGPEILPQMRFFFVLAL